MGNSINNYNFIMQNRIREAWESEGFDEQEIKDLGLSREEAEILSRELSGLDNSDYEVYTTYNEGTNYRYKHRIGASEEGPVDMSAETLKTMRSLYPEISSAYAKGNLVIFLDKEGNPVLDTNGKPVQIDFGGDGTTSSLAPVFGLNSNPAIEEEYSSQEKALGIPQQHYAARMLSDIYNRAANLLEAYYYDHGIFDAGTYLEGYRNIMDWVSGGVIDKSILHQADDLRKQAKEFDKLGTLGPETFKQEFEKLLGKKYDEASIDNLMTLMSGDNATEENFKKACEEAFGFRGTEKTENYIDNNRILGAIGDIALMVYTLGAASELKASGKLTETALKTMLKGTSKVFGEKTAVKVAKISTSTAIGGLNLGGFTFVKESANNLSNPMRDALSTDTWIQTGKETLESIGFGMFGGLWGSTVTSKVMRVVGQTSKRTAEVLAPKLSQGAVKGSEVMSTFLSKSTSPSKFAEAMGFCSEVLGFTGYESAMEIISHINSDSLNLETIENILKEEFGNQFQSLSQIKLVSHFIMQMMGGRAARALNSSMLEKNIPALRDIEVRESTNPNTKYEVRTLEGKVILCKDMPEVITTCIFLSGIYAPKASDKKEEEKVSTNNKVANSNENIGAKTLDKGSKINQDPDIIIVEVANDTEIPGLSEIENSQVKQIVDNRSTSQSDLKILANYLKKYPQYKTEILKILCQNINIKFGEDLSGSTATHIDKIIENIEANPQFKDKIFDYMKTQRRADNDTTDPTASINAYVEMLKKYPDYENIIVELAKNGNLDAKSTDGGINTIEAALKLHIKNGYDINDIIALSNKNYTVSQIRNQLQMINKHPELKNSYLSEGPLFQLIDKNPENTNTAAIEKRFKIKDELDRNFPNEMKKIQQTLGDEFFFKIQWEEIIPENTSSKDIKIILDDLNESSKFFARTSVNEQKYGKNIQWATNMKNISKGAETLIENGQDFDQVLNFIANEYRAYDEASTLETNLAERNDRRIASGKYRGYDRPQGFFITPFSREFDYSEYFDKFTKNNGIRKKPYEDIELTRILYSKDINPDTGNMLHPENKYVEPGLEHIRDKYKELEPLFEKVRNGGTLTKQDIETANEKISEIYFLMANIMPYERGSNGISDILMRSIYKSLKIDQPAIKHGVSLDLESFCMDLDVYKSKWNTFFEEN